MERPLKGLLSGNDDRPQAIALLAAIKSKRSDLQQLLDRCNDHWGGEDGVYRFYHHSFKVYGLQSTTEQIVAALREVAPDRQLN